MDKINLMQMTHQQHTEVYIKLNFEDYSEVFNVYELASDGSFTIEELQACCNMQGAEYIPMPKDGCDVATMQRVEDEDADTVVEDTEYNDAWRREIAREAGAMYGMQAYHDHMGYDVDLGADEGECISCCGRGCHICD